MKVTINRTVAALIMIGIMMPMGAYAVSVNDLADMMTRVEENIPAIRAMVAGFCYVMGLVFIFRAVLMFKAYGQARTMMSSNASMIKPVIILMVGVGLFALPDLIDVSMMTFYNYGSDSVYQYPVASDWSRVINPLITIVKLLGLIVFVKGFMMLSKYGAEGAAQPGVGGKAVMHMAGGVAAMNIVDTIDIVKASFGV